MIQFKSFNFRFVKWMWFWSGLSVLAVAGSIGLIAVKGLNFGTDFKGGTRLQYRFPTGQVSEGTLRGNLDALDLGDFSVQKIGRPEENRFLIKVEKQGELEGVSQKISREFKEKLNLIDLVLEQEESVGPKAGADLRKKAILAIVVSWLLILIYIGYRFNFSFAPGAIISLIHDVIVTLGAFALSGREVGLTVVAALLTIVGYSVNDTIVIYDRIRENMHKMQKTPFREVVDTSLNQTLSRTIITNFTVLLVVVLIYLFGEGEFQNFGFAMTVGAVAGSYSTLFVASPCYIFLKEHASLFKFKRR